MAGIKSLMKDTAVYGMSSIVGRFLNWLLVPLYVYIFPAQEYGIVSYLYSFTAVALVILNYGMETGFFRFANKGENPAGVYRTAVSSVGFSSLAFIILLSIFILPISSGLLMKQHPEYVWMLGFTVALDAFSNIPFAWLRFQNRAWRFAWIKMLNVGINIALNLFFLLLCPKLAVSAPASIAWFYNPLGGNAFGVGWIFLANVISTVCILLCLLPELRAATNGRFSAATLRAMLSYSWPLLILGVAGVLSQNMGQILIPYIFKSNPDAARTMVGLYGANIKIAIVMVMFTQAFRYAYEPFIFARAKSAGDDKKQAYADAMKYFLLFGLAIFLGVMYFLPLIKHFISPSYWQGLSVVPIMMVAELCFGIYFNLSLWYKLTDRTAWGMYLSLLCFVIMLGLNLWLIPAIGIPNGYIGSAWAALGAYFAVMVISWILGRHYFPIPYKLGSMALFTIFAVALWGLGSLCYFPHSLWLTYSLRILLLFVYLSAILLAEPSLKKRFIK